MIANLKMSKKRIILIINTSHMDGEEIMTKTRPNIQNFDIGPYFLTKTVWKYSFISVYKPKVNSSPFEKRNSF